MRKRDQDEFERVFRLRLPRRLPDRVPGPAGPRSRRGGDAGRVPPPLRTVGKRRGLRASAGVGAQVAVRDAIRRAKRERVVPVVVLVDPPNAGERLPDIDLLRAVGMLPPKQRAAVALHYLEEPMPLTKLANSAIDGVAGAPRPSSTTSWRMPAPISSAIGPAVRAGWSRRNASSGIRFSPGPNPRSARRCAHRGHRSCRAAASLARPAEGGARGPRRVRPWRRST